MSAHHPSRREFDALAADHAVVPVWREVLSDLETPLSVYAKLAGHGPSFLLESAEHGERWGRYSFIGVDPFLVLRGKDGAVRWEGAPPRAARGAAGPLDALERAVLALAGPTLPDLPPLHGGAVGYIGWDVVHEIERLPVTAADDLDLDDLVMLFPRHIVAVDHVRQRLTVVTNVVVDRTRDGQYEEAAAATDELVERLATTTATVPVGSPVIEPVHDAGSNLAPGQYRSMVRRALEHVAAGDVFQVVPSQRFALSTEASPFTVYRMLRVINPSPYLFLIDLGDVHLVGSSPEALVRVQGRRAETWPIAGTRPRSDDPAEDRALERALLASEKERAEHVMLVDLGRNDLGRVCEVGTVTVEDLMVVERYSHVMHLVSRVVGQLREDVTAVDVLRAAFPAGTVSGAPKIRAMEIIDDLEPTRRGIYGGAVGYLDFSGNLDTCIALRTLIMREGVAYAQAGAGIVADSDPAAEEAETRSKAMALLAAVRAAEAVSDGAVGASAVAAGTTATDRSSSTPEDDARTVPRRGTARPTRQRPTPRRGTVGQKRTGGKRSTSAPGTRKTAGKKAAKTSSPAKKSTKKTTKKAGKKSTKRAPAKKTTKKPAKKAGKKPAKKAGKKSAKKPAKKAGKRSTKKAGKKSTKKSSPAKKSTKRSTKKTGR